MHKTKEPKLYFSSSAKNRLMSDCKQGRRYFRSQNITVQQAGKKEPQNRVVRLGLYPNSRLMSSEPHPRKFETHVKLTY